MLTTERLLLRPWSTSDAEDLYRYASDPDVGPIAGRPAHTSVENSRQIIRDVLSADETYAVCRREDGRTIGSIGLFAPQMARAAARPAELEVGFWVGVPFWGRGYMPEAVRAMQRHAFDDLGCTALWSSYYDGNGKSKRVQRKCGFTFHHTETGVCCPPVDEVRTEHFTYLSRARWRLLQELDACGEARIRPINPSEHRLLDDFLYEAIFVPDGAEKPPRGIVDEPALRVYVDDFGASEHGRCLMAEADGQVVGCCLTRIMDDYGHVDDDTPSFLVSLLEPYRGRGIGTALMQAMLAELADAGYAQASLSVQKRNPAVRLYKRLGFQTVSENDEEFVLVKKLDPLPDGGY